PEPQQQPPFEDAGLHARVAHGPHEDRGMGPDLREHAVRKNLAGAKISLRSQVEMRDLEIKTLRGRDYVEDAQSFGCHLRADPVSRNNRDRMAAQPAPPPARTGRLSGTCRRWAAHPTGAHP